VDAQTGLKISPTARGNNHDLAVGHFVEKLVLDQQLNVPARLRRRGDAAPNSKPGDVLAPFAVNRIGIG
jgi:hypothetical protein